MASEIKTPKVKVPPAAPADTPGASVQAPRKPGRPRKDAATAAAVPAAMPLPVAAAPVAEPLAATPVPAKTPVTPKAALAASSSALVAETPAPVVVAPAVLPPVVEAAASTPVAASPEQAPPGPAAPEFPAPEFPAAPTPSMTAAPELATSPAADTTKEKTMEDTVKTATDYTEKFQGVFKDASEKAKAMLEKSKETFGDAGEFAKGNVEAMVESTKILAAGLQEMGKGYVAESKTAFETLGAELKELAGAKSPTEFFEKHTALLRKHFDAAVAVSSKNSEAMLKLANEAFQPISNRVSLAVEKMKQAA